MAAAEYYYGTAGAQGLNAAHSSHPQAHHPYQGQSSGSQFDQYAILPPPPYSPHPPQHPEQQQQQSYQQSQSYQQQTYQQPYQQHTYPSLSTLPLRSSYPQRGRATTAGPSYYQTPQYVPQDPREKQETLGPPLQNGRSRSQPARVRFADEVDSDTDSDSSSSSYEDPGEKYGHRSSHTHAHSHSHGKRPHRHRHHRHHSHEDDRAYDSRDSGRSERIHRRERRDRDTFLGAGAGGIVGDLIFPGLGTAAGLLLGGYGGRKYAEKKTRDGEEWRGEGR